jgi:hypothetical protein
MTILQISLGEGLSRKSLARVFVAAVTEHPEWLKAGLAITSIFDSFSGLLWNGGRVRREKMPSAVEMFERVHFFNSRNIGVYFTFTNCLLTKRHIENELCNAVLKTFEDPLNGIIINSELLEAHIRKVCPQYKMIFSLTKVEYDKRKLLAAADKYDLVVVPPEYNHDLEFLRTLPPQKAELLLNEDCFPFCPDRRVHYALISRDILTDTGADDHAVFCHEKHKPRSMHLSFAELQDIAAATGIDKVKYNFFNRLSVDDIAAAGQELVSDFIRPEYAAQFQEYIQSGFSQQDRRQLYE